VQSFFSKTDGAELLFAPAIWSFVTVLSYFSTFYTTFSCFNGTSVSIPENWGGGAKFFACPLKKTGWSNCPR